MDSQEIRLAILKDAYDRTKKGEVVLRNPEQYSRELGIPDSEIRLNLDFLIEQYLLNGTVERMLGGLAIYNIVSITVKGIGFVENAGKHSEFPETVLDVLQKQSAKKSRHYKIEKMTVPDFAQALDYAAVDAVIQKDCFPLTRPYRKHVGEAYLTLENVIKDELHLPSTLVGMDVISEAGKKGLFKREDSGEAEGLRQLFNASVTWLRNPAHHNKKDMPKSDALKMILFADYLIKTVRRQKKLNKL